MTIKSKNIAVIIYAGSAILLYLTGFLSFFICVPLIVAYYVRGYEFCKKSALVFFICIMLVRIVSIFSLTGNEVQTGYSSSVQDFGVLPTDSTYSLIYEAVYCISAIVAVMLLLRSRFIWPLRILVATFLLFASTYAQIRYIQDNLSVIDEASPVFFSMLERISGVSHFQSMGNSTVPVFNEGQSIAVIQKLLSTVLFFTWTAAMCIVILNWFIAIIITRRILGFNLNNYLHYVYTKIFSSYSVKMPFILVFSILIAFLLRNSTQTALIYVYNFLGNIVVVLLLCYMIYGLSTWYFILMRAMERYASSAAPELVVGQRKNSLRLRSDWYFFAICGIMIIPFVNTVISTLCIMMGMKKNIQYIKHTYAMRSNDESNS